ncbi:RNA 2',3'-cyclic phosphodiesterase [Salarchaeum sp. JOR-1]|uniref:RNA 2',3'-cyclic phosphodiesterase n=1 Tax=Salarchaeum sp. JOR-1 TaxID=2599399 RepID=UPI0011984030|nr:RNA 2',3'-cyclic phosphodiesterase [Salarchaeum sp. JOR-1]QDX40169.1 RNA 2',3'-cyclic phosphodiesterase [Salarchaeum sp. JOR-1]
MRLFVSVDLPGSLHDAVADVQDEFADADGLSFTDPTQSHVTMKFLGDVPDGEVEAVADALETAVANAGVEPFDATYGGLGVFPNLDYISVLWLGVESGTELFVRLHEAIEQELVAFGFDPEDHEFTPHVTLARLQHAGGKALVQELVREWSPTVGTARVAEVRLTKSALTQEGAEYETVASVSL